jgi:hypothetical protein
MQTPCFRPLLLSGGLLLVSSPLHAQYASQVLQYVPGTGGAPGYNTPSAALGEPSRVTPGPFGGPVDPFSPAYLDSQLVSLGAGGSLTLRFDQPIANDPFNPHGLDFLIFGGSGFIITNAFDENFQFIGTPATDGSLFGAQSGDSRVLVSADGLEFFTLNPALAPAVERLFPTDGSGDFTRAVDPTLDLSDFAGLTLDGIRTLYAGSGGGAGFDIAWAQDSNGLPVTLDAIRYVRIDILSGKAEIDAVGAVGAVPEPSSWLLLLGGTALVLRARRLRR